MLIAGASTRASGRLAASTHASGPGVSRAQGQHLARQELSRSMYQPSFWSRLWQHVTSWLSALHPSAGLGWPGWLGLVLFAAAAAVIVAAVLYHVGPVRGGAMARQRVAGGAPVSASTYRLAAESFARSGNYRDAIIAQVRAIAASLEARQLLPVRPGRTAVELGAEAGTVIPAEAAALAAAAGLFDAVRYGGRPGSEQSYQRIAALDRRISAATAASSPAVSTSADSRSEGHGQ